MDRLTNVSWPVVHIDVGYAVTTECMIGSLRLTAYAHTPIRPAYFKCYNASYTVYIADSVAFPTRFLALWTS